VYRRPERNLLRRVFYRISSGNRLSRNAGRLSEVPLPPTVIDGVVRAYCSAFRVSMDEVEIPPGGFRTFNDFFTRRLKPGSRDVEEDADTLVSPCDGRIMSVGTVRRGLALQAKGSTYPVARLLGDEALCARFEGGPYVTIYLSPRDYHRVHFPCDGEVVRSLHLPGCLYTVAPRAVDIVECLLCRNERLVTVMDTRFGTVAVTMVGAAGVGRISVSYGPVVTNVGTNTGTTGFDPPVPALKADDLGAFNVGSTVVMMLEPGNWEEPTPNPGDSVRMGQAVFRRVNR